MNPNDYTDLLSIQGVTVTGLLLVAVIYFAWRTHVLQKALKESENNRLTDYKSFTDKLEDIRKENYTWMNELKEVFRHGNR